MAPIIAACGAIIAAILSGVFAAQSRRAQHEQERAIDRAHRLADRKIDSYGKLIQEFGEMFTPGSTPNEAELLAAIKNFLIWAPIFGSDEVIRAGRNLMQASYAKAPATILLRYYAELVIAIRMDVGHEDTSLVPSDMLGMRVTDLYNGMAPQLDGSIEDLFQATSWRPPWPQAEDSTRAKSTIAKSNRRS